MKVIALLMVAIIAGEAADTVSGPAYQLINARTSKNQSQFFVYDNDDSPFNHGFPSGLFGTAMSKLHIDPSCVYSASAANGCSTDTTAMDPTRGTVFRFTFDPLVSDEYVGLNFEEPENWGVTQSGTGYDLTGATQIVFDAISPIGGIAVQFSVNGFASAYVSIPQQWSTITINLSSLGITSLTRVHLLFGIASNAANAPHGGTVLLDNIHFLPVPASETTALGLPLANQVFGIEHVSDSLPGSIPIPPDQINSNLATLYESSLAIIALIERGQPQDLTNAQLIADTLVYALGNDNQGDALPTAGVSKGLHNGISAGDIGLFNGQGPLAGQQGQVRLAGFTAPVLCPQTGFCLVLDGATGGNNAFAILGLLAAYKQFQNPAYLSAAITIASWIYGNLLDSTGTGYGGYFVGYPDQGLPKILQTGKSTENNADIFAAFTALASVESGLGDTSDASTWTARANVAGDFVMQMWDSVTGHFFSGTVPASQSAGPGIYPNGTHKGNDVINTFDFLDAATFTTLAMAPSSRYRSQIDWHLPVQWAADHFQSSITAAGVSYQGFDLIESAEHLPTDGPAGIAWEFTAQEVVAMKLVDALYGTSQFASSVNIYLSQIQQAQTTGPFTDSQGIVASTLQDGETVAPYQQCLVTPYQCVAERVGLAATIWGIAAEQSFDPLLSTILPALPSSLLSISKTHTGNFTQGQMGATYTVTVNNNGFALPASGTVSVTETLPTGLSLVSMGGTGWACSSNTCMHSDILNAGGSYPPITVTVNVAGNSPTLVVNQVSVSGGGSVAASATDPTTVTTTAEFEDVPATASYFDAANRMFQLGVTTGCVAGSTPQTRSFCPNESVTREQMAAFIVRAVTGTTTPAIYNTTPYFTDVPTTNPFFPHIQKLESLGITTGCAAGLFCPTDTIPRWEMAIFMIRARLALYGATFTTATTPYFADVPTNVEGNGVPFPFIQRSYEEHITAGCGTDPLIYCPDELVTRGQMASFIMRGLFNETTILGPTAPMLTGVIPNAMASTTGTQITVTITGVNTNFQTGETVTVPSGMLDVSSVMVNSATSISATLTVNSNAVAGPQALVVTSGEQNLTLPLAIKVGTY
jgi:uncharacterized repeat protein (TIGR01451 family)